jgi:hypothetical protein
LGEVGTTISSPIQRKLQKYRACPPHVRKRIDQLRSDSTASVYTFNSFSTRNWAGDVAARVEHVVGSSVTSSSSHLRTYTIMSQATDVDPLTHYTGLMNALLPVLYSLFLPLTLLTLALNRYMTFLTTHSHLLRTVMGCYMTSALFMTRMLTNVGELRMGCLLLNEWFL